MSGVIYKRLTRQMHTDANKRRCAMLFVSGDLQRYVQGIDNEYN